jgi:hypothetical protein
LDCSKSFCPTEEEAFKKSLDTAESSGAAPTATFDPIHVSDDDTVAPSGLTEKEQLRELAKKAKAAEREEKKKGKDARRAVEKAQRAADLASNKAKAAEAMAAALGSGRSGILGDTSATLGVSPSSSDSLSRLHLKRDASIAGFSASRLLQGTSSLLMDSPQSPLLCDEFLSEGSLQSMDAHLSKFNTLPQAWKDLQDFIDKVFLFFHNLQHLPSCFISIFFLSSLFLPSVCCLLCQHMNARPRHFSEHPGKSSGIDLMIVDVPENLSVPNISSAIPAWNALDDGFVDLFFDFGNNHIHDNGAMVIFHSDDHHLNVMLKSFMKAYHFRVFKEWMGINRLRLTSARDHSKTVIKFFSSIFRVYLILCFRFLIFSLIVLNFITCRQTGSPSSCSFVTSKGCSQHFLSNRMKKFRLLKFWRMMFYITT